MSEGQSAIERTNTVYPLGRYIVLAGLGRGGMADVFLAMSRGPSGFSKLVVLKLLREHLAEDQEFLRMFIAEARLAARLNHPNIVQTYEIGVEDGRHCIVMEYLEGRSFADVETATSDKPIALNLGLRILADALAGLHHAHERCDSHGRPLGLVHRDVSPHNVFITYDGQVKILDFGIAKAADDGAQTKTGVFKGKLRYTAPERFCAEETDRRADLFSVGVMLWQLLAKRRLWSGLTDLALMTQLANRVAVPSPRTVEPDVPESLERICNKALAIAPEDRFQTALEMQDAIEEVLSSESVGGTNRALGKFMVDVFGETRNQFQRVVDEQMVVAAAMPLDTELTASLARIRAQELPVLGADGTSDGLGMRLPSSSSRIKPVGGTITGSSPSAVAASLALVSDRPPARPARRRWIGVVGLAGLLATAMIGVAAFRGGATHDAQPPSSASLAAPDPSVGSPAPIAAATADHESAPPAPAASAAASGAPQVGAAAPLSAVASADIPTVKRGAWAPSRTAPVARPRPATSAADVHAVAPASESPPPKREIDCSSPYFIDDQGMKKVRVECL